MRWTTGYGNPRTSSTDPGPHPGMSTTCKCGELIGLLQYVVGFDECRACYWRRTGFSPRDEGKKGTTMGQLLFKAKRWPCGVSLVEIDHIHGIENVVDGDWIIYPDSEEEYPYVCKNDDFEKQYEVSRVLEQSWGVQTVLARRVKENP